MNSPVRFEVTDDLILELTTAGKPKLEIQLTVDAAITLGDLLLTKAGVQVDRMRKAEKAGMN